MYDMKLINFNELRKRLGGRVRSSIYLDMQKKRLPMPLKLGGRLYWEEEQLNAWIKSNLKKAASLDLH